MWDAWAKSLPPDLEDQVKNVWKESQRRSATGSASEQVRVVPTGPHRFDQQPLVLTPGEALSLLGRPLRVFLENGRYDRAFLLAFADAATHKALVEAEQAGWRVFETARGISELVVRAEDAITLARSSRVGARTRGCCSPMARTACRSAYESRWPWTSVSRWRCAHQPTGSFAPPRRRCRGFQPRSSSLIARRRYGAVT